MPAVARQLVVTWAGRHRRDEWDRLCGVYRRRIRRFLPLTEKAVKLPKRGDPERRRAAEGEALLAALPEPCWQVAVDRRGKARSSEQLAAWLRRRLDGWPHPIAFLVGSDLGLAPAVRRQCRDSLSFGPLTLPHELARLVLYEQLYRALSIDAGINYHRPRL